MARRDSVLPHGHIPWEHLHMTRLGMSVKVCVDCGTDQLPPSAYKFRHYICSPCVKKRRAGRPKKPRKMPSAEYISKPRTCSVCKANPVPERLKAQYVTFCDECYRRKRRPHIKPYVPVRELDDQSKLKAKARRLLRSNVYRGKIKRQPCEVCGSMDAHGHHEDYTKPLDVVWLCVLHHNLRHAEERRERDKCAA